VIAGNRNLADYVRRYNDSVFVVPTPVDTRRYAFVHRDRKKKLNIGWLGTANNLFYLKRIIPEILRFLDDFPDAHFYYMSNDDVLGVSHEKITFEMWSEEGQLNFLNKLSVGLMPLTDDDWSRGKCAFKALQYMSTGLPTIASDVGMNADVIQDDRNGLLAKDEGDWYLQLLKLKKNRNFYHSISRAARKTVEENYSIEECGSLLLNVFTKVNAGHEN
jgi:glycosyltransferase involved in cell wall biosynthesis